jgi:uncharacterized protein (TIGR01777 family)
MIVLITGATGVVGKEIVKLCLLKNIQVHYLTTDSSKLKQEENYKGFYWNPKQNEIDEACFKDVDAIIHLAGATISKRWTASYKKKILDSRVQVTKFLFESLKKQDHKVTEFIGASAIGLYPDSLTNYYDETYKGVSQSFLGDVIWQWESAMDSFSVLGINVAKIRIGLVLAKDGGALPQIIKPIRFGVGAPFGSGQHWQSWIHINDLAGLFLFVLKHQLEGVYNGVAPNPVTNVEFTKTIAKTLNRPLILPNIPKNIMQLVLGEMHLLLFESQRVSSKKVEDLGFEFKYHHLQPALQDLI